MSDLRPREMFLLRKQIGVGLLVVELVATSCSQAKPTAVHTTTTTVKPPSYTTAQQSLYFHDLYRNVPSAIAYVTEKGKSGLVTFLAYGAGFCRFLGDGQDATTAVSSLQSQAQGLEAKTGFQGSTADYESIGTDALIALCPSEQKALPAPERTQLQQIASDLRGS